MWALYSFRQFAQAAQRGVLISAVFFSFRMSAFEIVNVGYGHVADVDVQIGSTRSRP